MARIKARTAPNFISLLYEYLYRALVSERKSFAYYAFNLIHISLLCALRKKFQQLQVALYGHVLLCDVEIFGSNLWILKDKIHFYGGETFSIPVPAWTFIVNKYPQLQSTSKYILKYYCFSHVKTGNFIKIEIMYVDGTDLHVY